MDNKTIIKISLSVAMIGIIAMYIFTNISLNAISIAEASNFLGEKVTVKGDVSNYRLSKDGHAFFTINDFTGSMKVVAFRNSNIENAYNLKDDQKITLSGKVQEYKGAMEIIASKIDS
ncbi:MAG: OB-fold nucleic acid binding domain-containing protein [Nanoarchaeota archaeon]|nr:OB-fold nucleic acid binding domain-containing protein [Nanoarchaeota archaeon]